MFFSPVHPALEMTWLYLVAVYGFTLEVTVDFVQVQAVSTGNVRSGFQDILAQLVDVACTSGIISGGLDTSGQRACSGFESDDIVCLPAVQRQVEVLHGFHYFFHVYAYSRIAFFRDFIRFVYEFFFHNSIVFYVNE